jgi:hypothetical protein
MIGVLMFLKRLSDAGDGSSVEGLLDDEPILKELTVSTTVQGRFKSVMIDGTNS